MSTAWGKSEELKVQKRVRQHSAKKTRRHVAQQDSITKAKSNDNNYATPDQFESSHERVESRATANWQKADTEETQAFIDQAWQRAEEAKKQNNSKIVQGANLTFIQEEDQSPMKSVTPNKVTTQSRKSSTQKSASPKKQIQPNTEKETVQQLLEKPYTSVLGSSINGSPTRRPRRTRDERKNKNVSTRTSVKKENSEFPDKNTRQSMLEKRSSPFKNSAEKKKLSPIKQKQRLREII